MFRTLLAIGAVALFFGATLVIAGEKLGAWDSPEAASAPRSEPAHRQAKAAKPKAPSRPRARRKANRTPSWVAELNTLCRNAEAAVAAKPRPQSLTEIRRYIRWSAELSARYNRRAAAPLARAARRNPDAVRRLHELFADERRLFQDVLAAAERNDVEAFGQLGPDMVANGVEQSQLLVGLGAHDCSLPADLTFSGAA
jgi:hypothetical protein